MTPTTTASVLGKWKLSTRTQTSRADTFRQFILFAGAVGFSLAFALSGLTRLSAADAANFIHDALSAQLSAIVYVRMITYVVLFLFGLSWGLNALHELSLLQEWLKPEHFVVKRRNLIHATTMLIGVLLGVLFALTPDFHTFIDIFIFYTLVDLFLWKLRRDEIAHLIENTLQTLERDFNENVSDSDGARQQDVLKVFQTAAVLLREYYLERGHYGRVGAQLVGVVALVAVPWAWEAILPGRVLKDFTPDGITIVGYLLFVWCLSISEATVYIWRQDLDARLASLQKSLFEMRVN
jgi:hypothetical protein